MTRKRDGAHADIVEQRTPAALAGRRRPSAFRQSDITRAIRGARAAGLTEFNVLVDAGSGRIAIAVSDRTAHNARAQREQNEWDAI